MGCAFDLFGHDAEEEHWVWGLISLVEGRHRDLWADLKPAGHFDGKGNLLR